MGKKIMFSLRNVLAELSQKVLRQMCQRLQVSDVDDYDQFRLVSHQVYHHVVVNVDLSNQSKHQFPPLKTPQ